MFLGLRTIIYPAPDLQTAKAWWTQLLGIEPYFDEPYYVGYSVGGYELALSPTDSVADGPTTYWGVPDVDRAIERFVSSGAIVRDPIREVGGGIRVAVVIDPSGNPVGVIENPVFAVQPVSATDGPGR